LLMVLLAAPAGGGGDSAEEAYALNQKAMELYKAGRYLEALPLARRAIKAKYPQPFFWAVFILHGEG
jgi:CHAT domain-containing protein